ncbi:hypothetical protein HY419_00980, partial [candidate division WWE3 bacterium]|nr:hypothetical protein [candidate division WWE3 bacterium]
MTRFKNVFYLFVFFEAINFLAPTIASAQEGYKWAGAAKLSLPIIIGLGSIDAINPCVIGVLLLLLSTLLKVGDKKLVLKNGFAYTAGVYITYLVGGLTLLGTFNAVRSIAFISQIFYFVIGAFVILAGALEIKDFFWYGKWFSLAIPKRFVLTIEE